MVHVALWYIHRPESYDILTPLRPMYILYSDLEPLGTVRVDNRVCNFGCLKGVSKSVHRVLNDIEAVIVLTLISLK